jgi:hypothetical protein
MTEGEKRSAKAKDEQGGGKALSPNGNREDQASESVCQPYSDQKVIQKEAGFAVRIVGSSNESKGDQETYPLWITFPGRVEGDRYPVRSKRRGTATRS